MTALVTAFSANALLYLAQALAFAVLYRRRRETPIALWLLASLLLLGFAVATALARHRAADAPS